jgi:hypothetical protein
VRSNRIAHSHPFAERRQAFIGIERGHLTEDSKHRACPRPARRSLCLLRLSRWAMSRTSSRWCAPCGSAWP